MDISVFDFVLICVAIFAVSFTCGGVCVFFWYDRYATRRFNYNLEEFEKALSIKQKEIDILNSELDEADNQRRSIQIISASNKVRSEKDGSIIISSPTKNRK